jgi:hypothetical protein
MFQLSKDQLFKYLCFSVLNYGGGREILLKVTIQSSM